MACVSCICCVCAGEGPIHAKGRSWCEQHFRAYFGFKGKIPEKGIITDDLEPLCPLPEQPKTFVEKYCQDPVRRTAFLEASEATQLEWENEQLRKSGK